MRSSSRNSSGPFSRALFFLVAISGFFAPRLAVAQETEIPSGCAMENGAALLANFLAVDNQPMSLIAGLLRDNAEVEFLFATVPEPRLGFDGVVEAIATALEGSGHTLDRYALPWMQRPDKGNARCQEYLPGVALFVGQPNFEPSNKDGKVERTPRHLIVVYFISESPTAGVSRLPFLRAVNEMASLRGQLPQKLCYKCGEARLLGPAFSGAVASLEQVLEHPAVRGLPFRILSGRATDSGIREQLERHSSADRRITYNATMIPDETLQAEFFCYLTETLGADEHDIALLTESSTVFGQAAAQRQQQNPHRGHDVQPLKGSRCRDSHPPRLTLPVPLHVSRLNAAWAARQQATQKSTAQQQDPLGIMASSPVKSLPKLFDQTVSERMDVIPTLSPETIVSTDRALATILTTISAERVRYVGLVFTDEQDTLFLAEQLRKFCPDVVLFTFDNNLVYTHPDARPTLKGMLTVSTYPLFTRNQQWSYPFRGYNHRIQFSRDSNQGVYNAAVALLDRNDLLLEYSQPVSPGRPEPNRRPPIWISAVGIEMVFPLVFIADYKDSNYVYVDSEKRDIPRQRLYIPYQQGTLSLLLVILGLAGAFIATGYFRVHYTQPGAELRFPWTLFRLFQRSALFNPQSPIGAQENQRQPLFMLAIFLPMALLYPFFTSIHFVQMRDGNAGLEIGLSLTRLPFYLRLLHHSRHIGVYEGLTWQVLIVGIGAAACQLAFMITAFDVLLSCFSRGRRLRAFLVRRWQSAPRLMTTTLAALFTFFTFMLFRGYLDFVNILQRDFNHMVFMRRAAHPAFGLSPLTPLLILVMALQLWGYCNLQRIRYLEKLATVFLEFIEELEAEKRLRGVLAAIIKLLESPSRAEFFWGTLLTLVLISGLFSDLVSLERYPLNFVFRLLFALICVGVSFAAYTFLRVWLHFSRFLELIAHHPLVLALERMPEPLARSIGSLFIEELPEQARYEAEQAHLQLLRNQLSQLDLEKQFQTLFPNDTAAMKKLLEELQQAMVPMAPPPDSIAVPRYDENGLVKVAKLLTRLLKAFWQARPLPGTLPSPESVPLNQSTEAAYARALPPGLALWLRLAEDFIAIQVVSQIHRLFPHLRNGLLFFTGALLLMLAAIVTYPFQPQHFLSLILWALVLGSVGLTVVVFIQMNRNETLSRIARTEPGKVSFDRRFLSQVVIYGVLPLLSLLAAQFPEVRGVAFSWFETILKTLK